MLVEAVYRPTSDTEKTVDVGFVQPEVPILGGRVQSRAVVIEYQTSDMPTVTEGDRLLIKGVQYRVRAEPELKGDGYFSTVQLSE